MTATRYPKYVWTPDDVLKRVAKIADVGATDPEAAHGMLDILYVEVMRAIANGNVSDARLCAQAAMKAADLDFPRWCA